MITFFGRLHILMLHLPIGILLMSAALALWSHWKKTTLYRQAIEQSVKVGAITAVLAAACGWVLAWQGDYSPETLFWHRWTGSFAAVCAVAAWWMQYSKWYFAAIYATNLAIIVAGHFGGTITHGEGFIFKSPENKQAVPDPNQPAYAAVIQPIFDQKCVSCHNPNKKKGGLMLDSWEHLQAGGKSGRVIIPGSTDSSELYKRLLLPAHDEHRMPPKGKMQLTPEETESIGKWIKAGASRDLPASAVVTIAQSADFPDINVTPANASDLNKLREKLIPVMPLGKDLPWLSVSLAGKNDLSPALLKSLQSVSDQITHLDANHSNLSDEMMESLRPLKNLTRLHLAGTKVTAAGLAKIAGLKYLHYLNLTGTPTDDGIVQVLASLPALTALYLRDTKVTAEGMAQLQKQFPNLTLNDVATADSAAAPLQLLPPKMFYSKTVFDDTVQVKLDFPFKNVALYYTLDQASPTTQSLQYKGEPIVLSETGMVRAMAVKAGWNPSTVVEASFAKRKYKPVDAQLLNAPNPKYPAKGAASLFDNILGADANDGTFLGYQGEHLTAVLDFGKMIEIKTVGAHYLENNAPWIFAPAAVQVWASTDAKKWVDCGRSGLPVNTSMQPAKTGIAQVKLARPTEARYIKIKVENLMKLPQWHPSAGDKSWVFVDEILVE